MRIETIVRVTAVLMCLASIGVAGTTVVMNTAGTMLGQTGLDELVRPAEQEQEVQADPLEQLHPYQVRLSASGEVEGRVNIVNPLSGTVGTAQDMSIAFLQNGQVVAETYPGLEGQFQVALAPGLYSVVGSGADGYVAFGMHVLPAELTVDNSDSADTQPVAFQEVVNELTIDSVAVPTGDLPTVASLARSNIPPGLLTTPPTGEGLTPSTPLTPEEQAQFTNQQRDVSLTGHQVQIRADGRLVGRMSRVNQDGEPTRIRRLNAFLVRDNQVVAQAPVGELGSFEFYDVQPGIYSFVAAGMDGLAAFTMQAVDGPNMAGIPDELTLVSAVQGGNGQPAGATTAPEDTGYAVSRLPQPGAGAGGPGAPIPGEGVGGAPGGGGGAFGGGFGGGGGGLGGLGGLGALLGAAGLAAGIAALVDDDDDDTNVVVSPAGP